MTSAEPPGRTIVGEPPGSFPWTVLYERHPALLKRVLGAFPYPPDVRAAVEALGREITGVIEPLADDAADVAVWSGWAAGYLGRRGSEVPFLWAENYFYRKLLAAVGYLRPGPGEGIDPFAPFKDAELADPRVDAELAALDDLPRLPPQEQLDALVSAALWGNQADLGFLIQDGGGGGSAAAARGGHLVVDDREVLRELLAGTAGVVALVADNAGRELLPDLVLIDRLLAGGRVTRVVLHVKPRPYFVSDAMPADVLAALRRLRAGPEQSRAIGDRLWAEIEQGRLVLRADPFSVAPMTYHELPAPLRSEFAAASLTIMKGDLNYRRLVGDRDWPATASFAELTGYFPSPVVALRTLKSNVVVGVSASELAALDGTGTPWRTSGDYGLVQARA